MTWQSRVQQESTRYECISETVCIMYCKRRSRREEGERERERERDGSV
jgi:hypothetical protein